MYAEINQAVSSERVLGAELARAAESLLAVPRPDAVDPALAIQIATAELLLALYWELRHEAPDAAAAGGTVVSINRGTRRRSYRGPRASDPGA
jgi:hypothetical protein